MITFLGVTKHSFKKKKGKLSYFMFLAALFCSSISFTSMIWRTGGCLWLCYVTWNWKDYLLNAVLLWSLSFHSNTYPFLCLSVLGFCFAFLFHIPFSIFFLSAYTSLILACFFFFLFFWALCHFVSLIFASYFSKLDAILEVD